MSIPRNALDLSDVPIFCAHEHWGSIDPIGMSPQGFRSDTEAGATPTRRVGLLDIVLDPYFYGFLTSAGADLDGTARRHGYESILQFGQNDIYGAWQAISGDVGRQRLTGAYQCLRRGVLALHGIDMSSADGDATAQVDGSISRAYEDIFAWHRESMDRAHLGALARPVHPVFYAREQSPESAAEECAFTGTLLRIDPLLEMWRPGNPHTECLSEMAGVEPVDAESWRKVLVEIFDKAAQNCAIGIKQLQAYHRDLDFRPRGDSEVVFSGILTPEQVRVFQDWVVHECCKQANDRGWPHQVHVGTHNITECSPMPLAELASRYPGMKIVLIHCWPFLREAGWLAKQFPNVYLDTCWLPVLNPAFYREALETWLGYVPYHKIMCSQDSTSVEMAVGSSLFVRGILADVLSHGDCWPGLPEADLRRIAADILYGNAESVYDSGGGVRQSEPELV